MNQLYHTFMPASKKEFPLLEKNSLNKYFTKSQDYRSSLKNPALWHACLAINQVINLHDLSYFLLRKALFLQALAEGLDQKLMKSIGCSSGILIIVIVQNRNAWLVPLNQNFYWVKSIQKWLQKAVQRLWAPPVYALWDSLTYTAIFSYINLQEDSFLGLIANDPTAIRLFLAISKFQLPYNIFSVSPS